MKVWQFILLIVLSVSISLFFIQKKTDRYEKTINSIQSERDSLDIQLFISNNKIDSLERVKDSVRVEVRNVVRWRDTKQDEIDTLSSTELIQKIKAHYNDTIKLEKINLRKVDMIVVDSISITGWYNTIQDKKEAEIMASLYEHGIGINEEIIGVLKEDRLKLKARYDDLASNNIALIEQKDKWRKATFISSAAAFVLLIITF